MFMFRVGHTVTDAELESALEASQWDDHLNLVAMFAPELFAERNPSTGNTFLNFMMNFNHQFTECLGELIKFEYKVLDCGPESMYISNFQGRTPFGHIFQNLIAVDESPHRRVSYGYVHLVAYFVRSRPSNLAPWAVGSVGETAEPPPFLLFTRGLVDLLNDSETLVWMEPVKSLLNRVTDDWCDNVVDQSGNTALHIAIAVHVSEGLSPRLHRARQGGISLARQVLTRVMTRQAAMTRNKDGKLPIDLALEGNKQPWISKALSEIAPKLLEYRNSVSKLYPFQTMAAAADDGTSIAAARLSTCYSMLRMAPHLVSTALTEENTAFLQRPKFVEASRLGLEIEREWTIGWARAKEQQRILLEQQEQRDSRKRKRFLDVQRLVEESKRP